LALAKKRINREQHHINWEQKNASTRDSLTPRITRTGSNRDIAAAVLCVAGRVPHAAVLRVALLARSHAAVTAAGSGVSAGLRRSVRMRCTRLSPAFCSIPLPPWCAANPGNAKIKNLK
jgi:hypothetical protein